MHNYLKQYNVSLEVVGPIFIGSGRELGKKEYLLNDKEIKVVDIAKLYAFISRKGLGAKFEEFMLSNRNSDLRRWLDDNRISITDINNCYKYKIEHTDSVLSRGTNISVMEFMRDAYGLPYVPGSSIKGMIRTILLGSSLMKQNSKYNMQKMEMSQAIDTGSRNRNTFLRQNQTDIEAKMFNILNRKPDKQKDAVNDCFSGLIISDSKHLENEDLILCQRLEYHVDGSEKRLNVLRECVRPGTKIEFTVTIDEDVFSYSMDDIVEAINTFSDMYDEVFKEKFPEMGSSLENTCYLGGGVGFPSKTDIYPLFGEQAAVEKIVKIFDATKVPENHKHYRDIGMKVSPHILKVTRYKGKLYNMGECRWIVENNNLPRAL